MNPLRIAVVGAGRLGGFHAKKMAARDDVELVAVVDPVEANRRSVAAQCRTAAFADYSGLLDRLDGAVIAAPTTLHHAIAKDFLAAGVPVLIEKPICATREEADELVDLARRRGVLIQVGHVERFNPAFQFVLGQIAKPTYIETTRMSVYPFRSFDVGAVLDVMIHDIDLVLSMFRTPLRRVEAQGFAVVGPHEDVAAARLEFECGGAAHLTASRVGHEQVRRMAVWSSECYASIDFASRTATTMRPSETLRRGAYRIETMTAEEIAREKETFLDEHLPTARTTFDAVDALALEDGDFVEAIRSSREPMVNGAAGRDALEAAEWILDCIAPRRRVIPAPNFTHSTPLEKAG